MRLTLLERTRAALAVSAPGAYASHHTAAALWGGSVPDTECIHLSVPDGAPRTKRAGIRAHRGSDAVETGEHRGVPLTTPLQCLIDLAADGMSLVDLVVLGDSLLKRERFTLRQLHEAAKRWIGRGAKIARRAAALMRKGVDSAMESRLRLLLVLAGLPEPEVNVILRNENGEWVARFDLCYRRLKLIIEYDGRQHGELEQWRHDSRRRELLDRLGWRVLTVHSDGIYANPFETLERIRAVLVELGYTPLRRGFRPEWSRYFPGRG